MQPIVAITLIICGTIVAGMPIVLFKIGAPLRDGGFLIYLGLAAGMVTSGVIGSFLSKRHSPRRGFEPVMDQDAA